MRRPRRVITGTCRFLLTAGVLVWCLILASSAGAGTYIVVNADDSGTGSLRSAVELANAAAGPDTVQFNIPGAGPHTIQLASTLPIGTDTLVVDGYTQPGASPATAVSPATLMIELDGQSAGVNSDGIRFSAGGSVVRGLVLNRFDRSGVRLMTNGGNRVEGNYVGTDITGTVALSNGTSGVIVSMVSDNTVGGTSPAARNIISGNDQEGVWLYYAAHNVVQGNYIGTDPAGTVAVPNGGAGVRVGPYPCDAREGPGVEYSNNNTIGGSSPGSGNLISGNASGGIVLADNYSYENVLQGNYIGTDATGAVSLGNGGAGITDRGVDNTIGGVAPGARNVISGNTYSGIALDGQGALVRGNYIGTDATGASAVPNGSVGVDFSSYGSANTVGGPILGARNVISGNHTHGVRYYGSSGNVLQGNYIGTTADGSTPLGNQGAGVYHWGGSANTVGGTSAGEPNTIAYNGASGVAVAIGTGNTLSGNSIHSNVDLGVDLGNDGVTANDSCDVDAGANDLQNHPVLSDPATGPFATSVEVALNSTPNTSFSFEFFSNSTQDPTGYGEGETFLASVVRSTDAAGDVWFTMYLSPPLPAGHCVTATATNPSGSTSEFSPVVYPGEVMTLGGALQAGALQLSWSALPGAAAYWVYGADNQAFFHPGTASPYQHRLAEVPSGTTTWAAGNGLGDADHNWTYLIVAVGDYQQEMARSSRFGEQDFGLVTGP